MKKRGSSSKTVFNSFMDTSMIKISQFWFVLSSLVVLWDAGFVLLRPATMPGGHLHLFWKPYALYIQIDKAYGDLEDPFTIAQSWMNLVEIFFSLAAVVLLARKARAGLLLAFFVSSLTFWKTFLYMLQYTAISNGAHRLAHTSWSECIFLFVVPNGVWLVFPFFFVCFYGNVLLASLSRAKD